jgi:hypothetical protein
VSEGNWKLDEEAQDKYLLPWLDSELDLRRIEAVIRYLVGLTKDPDRPNLNNGEDVYSAEVAGFGLVWLLDVQNRTIVLVDEPRDLT